MNDYNHKMTYGDALRKIFNYLKYAPVYVMNGNEVRLTDLPYLMSEEVVLSFDTEHGTTIENAIDITFKDGNVLTPLPF